MGISEMKGNNNDQGARIASLEQEVKELVKKLYDQKNSSNHPSSSDIVISSDSAYLKRIIEDQEKKIEGSEQEKFDLEKEIITLKKQ